MLERKDVLTALKDNFHDTATRGIVADWFEEHGVTLFVAVDIDKGRLVGVFNRLDLAINSAESVLERDWMRTVDIYTAKINCLHTSPKDPDRVIRFSYEYNRLKKKSEIVVFTLFV